MEYDKIMAGGNLDNIVARLTACTAMIAIVHANMSDDGDIAEALYGCVDSLTSIKRDFEADIACADDYIPTVEVVA